MDEQTRLESRIDRLAQLAENARGKGNRAQYLKMRRQLLNEQARLWTLTRRTQP